MSQPRRRDLLRQGGRGDLCLCLATFRSLGGRFRGEREWFPALPLLPPQISECPRLHACLTEQEVVERRVGSLRAQRVVIDSAQRLRDVSRVVRVEEDGDELQSPAARVVVLLRDEHALEVDSLALPGLLMPAESAVIGFGADQQDEIRFVQLVEHPSRPSLGRRAVDVLVQPSVDAVLAKPFGEREHPLLVLGRVMTVADESPRVVAHRGCSDGVRRACG